MQSRKCYKCGTENTLKAKSCFNCGAKLTGGANILYLVTIGVILGLAFLIAKCTMG